MAMAWLHYATFVLGATFFSGVAAAAVSSSSSLTSSANPSAASSSSTSASATSSVSPAVHSVSVGVGGFSYDPVSIQAAVGDTILFEFLSGNHSVARAEYKFPCIPYEDTGKGKIGFWSGFLPATSDNPETNPVYRLRVNTTEPVFFYCSAPGACVDHRMVGVINPNSSQTLANQVNYITASSIQYSPGESPPSESASSTTPTPTPSSTSGASSGSAGLSGGEIAGIVVGSIAGIALIGAAFYLFGRNRSLSDVIRYSTAPPPRPDVTPTLPTAEPSSGSLYASSFTPKLSQFTSQGPNAHDSWHTEQQRVISTDMAEGRGLMSLNPTSHGYANSHSLDSVANAQSSGQPTSNEARRSQEPVMQYAVVPQQNEMDAFHSPDIISPDLSTPGFQGERVPEVTVSGPHELDARPSVPDSPNEEPPSYTHRAFSFRGGSDSTPGVEKVLRE